jgi:hypothetical protein
MFSRLSKQTRGFQLRFWQFYWSSLEANNNYDKECDKLKKMYPVDNFPTQRKGHTLFKVRKKQIYILLIMYGFSVVIRIFCRIFLHSSVYI